MAAASPLSTAVRNAARFDRRAIEPVGGALAAVPVVALLATLIATGKPVWAVTSAVGAMFVGIAWRISGGRPPLAVMAIDAIVMGLSTLSGCVSGEILWLHLVLLALWGLIGGMLVTVGRRAGGVGFQAILAAVVFGRFTEPLAPALGIAGLVTAGGLVQVAFLTIVRWPTPLAFQRRATARALTELATLATGSAQTSGLPAAAALDEAEASLAGPSLLGSPAVSPLRSLVNEGYRLRVVLAALNGLAGRLRADGRGARAVHAVAVDAGSVLTAAAGAVAHHHPSGAELSTLTDRVTQRVDALASEPEPTDEPAGVWDVLLRRLGALGGQLRAIATLAPEAGSAGGLRDRRPQARTNHPTARLRNDLELLRANLSLRSPAARHALRLAVIVPATELLVRVLPVDRGYWVVIAAAAVLRPEFGATFTRGTERAGGTTLGVAIAGAIVYALHPGQAATIALVGAMGWAAFTTFQASYAVGFAFITALVVFLLNTVAPDTLQVVTARLIDTVIGGAIGLLLFAAWPTWARGPAQESLAELATSARRYAAYVLGAIEAGTEIDAHVRGLARAARLARTRAEADVARSLSEPATHRIDPRKGPAILAEMLRITHALHGLRLEAEDDRARGPVPGLSQLARALDVSLDAVARALQYDDLQLSTETVDLRAVLHRFAADVIPAQRALIPVLDELVDATNSLSDLLARAGTLSAAGTEAEASR